MLKFQDIEGGRKLTKEQAFEITQLAFTQVRERITASAFESAAHAANERTHIAPTRRRRRLDERKAPAGVICVIASI